VLGTSRGRRTVQVRGKQGGRIALSTTGRGGALSWNWRGDVIRSDTCTA